MSNVVLQYPGPLSLKEHAFLKRLRVVETPVPVISAARRRPLILGMPPGQFVLRAVLALVIGFAWAMVLPRIVVILAEQAVLASFPR